MKQILIYADSLSWGIIPNTRNRLAFDKRWPGVLEPKGAIADKFYGAEIRSKSLVEELKKIAEVKSTGFFDSHNVTTASSIDGIHLDEYQHQILGEALTQIVSDMLKTQR